MMIVRWWWIVKQTVPGSWGCGKRDHEACAKIDEFTDLEEGFKEGHKEKRQQSVAAD